MRHLGGSGFEISRGGGGGGGAKQPQPQSPKFYIFQWDGTEPG